MFVELLSNICDFVLKPLFQGLDFFIITFCRNDLIAQQILFSYIRDFSRFLLGYITAYIYGY